MSAALLKVTLKTGVIGATERQKRTVLGLGLKYRQATRTLKDSPAIRGMIHQVKHLIALVKEEKTDPYQGIPEYELGGGEEEIKKGIKEGMEKGIKEGIKEEGKKEIAQTSETRISLAEKKSHKKKAKKTISVKAKKKHPKKTIKKVK